MFEWMLLAGLCYLIFAVRLGRLECTYRDVRCDITDVDGIMQPKVATLEKKESEKKAQLRKVTLETVRHRGPGQ